jgi:hypothetical protein
MLRNSTHVVPLKTVPFLLTGKRTLSVSENKSSGSYTDEYNALILYSIPHNAIDWYTYIYLIVGMKESCRDSFLLEWSYECPVSGTDSVLAMNGFNVFQRNL